MWSSGAIREWYQTAVGRRVMAQLVQELKGLEGIGWVGTAQPEVLVSAVGLELATPWPTARVVNGWTAAGDECRYDRMVLMHELERAPNAEAFMTQCERLLRPDGLLVLLVANRASPWSIREAFSPFGFGHPYSPRQLEDLLGEAGLNVVSRQYGLFMPPVAWVWRRHGLLWSFWQALWHSLFWRRLPWLGGVIMMVARKDVLSMKAMKLSPEGKVVLQPVGVTA